MCASLICGFLIFDCFYLPLLTKIVFFLRLPIPHHDTLRCSYAATQVPDTWGFSVYQTNNMIRTGDIKQYTEPTIEACHAACAAMSAKSGSKKVCSFFSWYPYLLVDEGRCFLSTAAMKPRSAGGWVSLAVNVKQAKMKVGEYPIHRVTEQVGQSLVLCVTPNAKTKKCDLTAAATNPVIQFSAPDKEATQVYSGVVGSDVLTVLLPRRDSVTHPNTGEPDVFIMKSPRKDCQKNLFKAGSSFVGFATSKTDETIQFYKHDPRMRLLENTLDSPADISAARDKGVFGHSTAEAKCPLVNPNFLNENKCVRHTEGTCSPLQFTSDKAVKLDRTNLRLWYTSSHKHVLAVQGLAPESSPCTRNLRSRWHLVPGKCKGGPSLDADTKKILVQALRKQNGMCDHVLSSLPEDERSYSSVAGNAPVGYGAARSQIDSPQAWSAAKNKAGEWLQFDLGEARTVVGTVVQPRRGSSGQYVKIYQVQHSLNGKDWKQVTGQFLGRASGKKVSYFPAPVSARYVRLVVSAWNKHISVRADVLLCRNAINPYIRDVSVSDLGDGTCATSKSTIGAKIQVTTETCWEHVNADFLNVYDFTGASVKDCPSFQFDPMRNQVNVVAESGLHIIKYTDTAKWKALKAHGYTIGNEKVMTVQYVGRFGDTVEFANLDPDLQTLPMANALGIESSKSTVGFDACGSRAEVANDPLLGNMLFFYDDRCFDIVTKKHTREEDFRHTTSRGKEMLFTNIVLKAPDQLRQRVAWALSQIFVISVAVGSPHRNV